MTEQKKKLLKAKVALALRDERGRRPSQQEIEKFTDTASGAQTARPGLENALNYLRTGDTLVVWRLDRLGRSLKHLIEAVSQLQARGIGFRSITESIDTTTSGGKLIFHVFGACRVRAGHHPRAHQGWPCSGQG